MVTIPISNDLWVTLVARRAAGSIRRDEDLDRQLAGYLTARGVAGETAERYVAGLTDAELDAIVSNRAFRLP
jgi:hypothetical protein